MGFAIPVSIGASLLGGLTSSYDQTKHAARIDAINTAFAAAMAGDYKSEIQLRCWAGEKTPEAVAYGMVGTNEVCRIGDDAALAYAKQKAAELKLRKAAGTTLAKAGTAAYGAAEIASPGAGVAEVLRVTAANFTSGTTFGLPTPLVVIGAAVGIYFLLRRR